MSSRRDSSDRVSGSSSSAKSCARCNKRPRVAGGSRLCEKCERSVCAACKALSDAAKAKRKCETCQARAVVKQLLAQPSEAVLAAATAAAGTGLTAQAAHCTLTARAPKDSRERKRSRSDSTSARESGRPRSASGGGQLEKRASDGGASRADSASSHKKARPSSSSSSSAAAAAAAPESEDELRARYQSLAERVRSFEARYADKLRERHAEHERHAEPARTRVRELRAQLAAALAEQRAKGRQRTAYRNDVAALESRLARARAATATLQGEASKARSALDGSAV